MTILTWIAAFASGLLASMGVGGGMILIIWLTAVMGMDQMSAQGINLLFFMPIALYSVISHCRSGLIEVKKLIPAMVIGAAGAAGGFMLAKFIGTDGLKDIFSVFILIVGVKEIISAFRSGKDVGA